MSTINDEPLVAVITRTKDRPRFLERAAHSVLGQHFEDLVWIVVNDGGDPVAVETLVERHPEKAAHRIQLIHQPTSLGMQNAANAGINRSRSKYVVLHDDDDTWDPRFLDIATEHLERTGAMGVATATELVTERINGDQIEIVERSRMFPGRRGISIYRMCYENQFAPIAFVFQRQAFETIGCFDQDLQGYGDWDFHLRFLERYDVDYVDTSEPLAFYRQRPEVTGSEGNSVFQDDQHALADKMFNKWMRADIKRGRLGLGYVVNSLRNSTLDQRQAVIQVLTHMDDTVDQAVRALAVNLEKHSKEMQATVTAASMRVSDAMGHQHRGLAPLSHRVLERFRQRFHSQKRTMPTASATTRRPLRWHPNGRAVAGRQAMDGTGATRLSPRTSE